MAQNDDDRVVERIPSEIDDQNVSLRGYEILTYPADFTLEILVDKWKKGEIKVPRLQRNYIWTQSQASKLVESFLMGLPVPPVFFYQDRDDNSLLVIDGQQRLRSIVYFFSGIFGDQTPKKRPAVFNLVGLDEQSPYLNATYQQLNDHHPATFNKLKNSVLRSFVMKQLDPNDDTSIFQVFERLNTGGVVLQGQEIRNCIYEGKFNDLLRELNEQPNWRSIFGKQSFDRRMRDVELILRFFALLHNAAHYKKPMKKFLNDFMKANQNPSQTVIKRYREEFTSAADLAIKYLGQAPFNLHRGLNVAFYDSVFTAIGRRLNELEEQPVTGTQTKRLRTRVERLKENLDYLALVTRATTDDEVVPKRIDFAEQALFG